MAMATFLSLPPPQPLLLPRLPTPPSRAHPILIKPLHTSTICSSSSSSPIVAEEEEETSSALPPSPPDGVSSAEAQPAVDATEALQFRGCKTCGREEIERGCNGDGRIQGGIATVPGFGWWPIKAFRPCPGFVASGGRYRRRGQNMDEVAFGRGEREMPTEGMAKAKSSKRRQGSKRLKG
ncbi:uncharacterized protein LOC103702585 [Phoenix dactylifera]|uniref:Uncharacterized protein LOC103702585 n=1 Tax=Phoenix dactylifera TaxID=42345 RepID=A0A8B8J2C2_PHODC|nr:uncharacterized protein LOC103702585 [Phoenix dactylifera]XP_026658566.1 uncharacterized protein LOC103702585 [Phoenix dactylifera]